MGAWRSRMKTEPREGNKLAFDPDEKWSNLYREREKNHLYKWVEMRKGGELITIYERDGEEGVLRFAEEKLLSYLFDDGNEAHEIKFSDYVKWKKQVNVQLGLSEEGIEMQQPKFRDHHALWKLNKRGVDGENIIHLLLNREQPVCYEIGRILLKKLPGLVNDVYLGDELFDSSEDLYTCVTDMSVHSNIPPSEVMVEIAEKYGYDFSHIKEKYIRTASSMLQAASDYSLYFPRPSEADVTFRELCNNNYQADLRSSDSIYSMYSAKPSETDVTCEDLVSVDWDCNTADDLSIYSSPLSEAMVTFQDVNCLTACSLSSLSALDLVSDASIYSPQPSECIVEMPFPISSYLNAPMVSDSMECTQKLRHFNPVPVEFDDNVSIGSVSVYSIAPSEMNVEFPY